MNNPLQRKVEHMSLQEDSSIGEDDSSSSLHPDRYVHERISKLEIFTQDLQKAVAGSFPRSNSPPCTSVHVLLLRWVEDNLNVQFELTQLKNLFEVHFKFATEQWDIPSQNPTRALQTKLYCFQDAHQDENELLIVYYGGHGYSRRGRSIWAANRKPESPTLLWSSLQHLLETAVPNVLIILDCCFASNAATDTAEGRTTKELLAACGRENQTTGVGSRSFTSALIEELRALGQAPFSVAMLHSRLVTMRWRLAYTPIYALLSEHGRSSITIAPMHTSSNSTMLSNSDTGLESFNRDIIIAHADFHRSVIAVALLDTQCQIGNWISRRLVERLGKTSEISREQEPPSVVNASGHEIPVDGTITLTWKWKKNGTRWHEGQFFIMANADHLEVLFGVEYIVRENLISVNNSAMIPLTEHKKLKLGEKEAMALAAEKQRQEKLTAEARRPQATQENSQSNTQHGGQEQR